MKDIKHIFFDLDHTLWDFEANSKKTYLQIFRDNNLEIDIQSFLEKYIPINHQYWKLYREEKVSKEQLRYGRLKDTFNQMNYTYEDGLIDKLAIEYIDNLSNYNQLFEGTTEILHYLKPKYNLHIITNGFKEIQQAKLEKSGIANFFNTVITSESVGVKKPNPKVFHYALETTNAKTYQSLMIGDNLEADIYGAKNVGIKTLFFNPDKKPVPSNVNAIVKLKEIKYFL